AIELGLIKKIADKSDILSADIIVLAMPIIAVQEWLLSPPNIAKQTTIIDLCSTKQGVIDAACSMRQNFVAAHPMCGTEYSGPNAAVENLYSDKTVVLCNADDSGVVHLEKATKLFEDLNMKIVQMSAKLHDKHAAFISHLPHLLSFALANAVLSQESPENILTMAAGGFKDMSRLAKSAPSLWEQIFFANQKEVLQTIEIFENELSTLKNAIANKDSSAILHEMQEANTIHKLFGQGK
ncbi:MAG: hypothetical protein RL154_1342, partial [Pseudomonadota bacterium]